ncbi:MULTISPECIES: hypothetical protein [Burkholderia]|uniref:hypothetical protein n=1 Tax=Burkholderia TaxID=32008 RepID=UPI0007560318|nr:MULTISPECIES: hypothetical protein [Burkholderia]AOJ73351.1 hypothetical protein WS78_31180 [Burkholderia savannae]KVG41199.1 hypothetical protein WS77_17430 [Burkholderia sp. MSMB0265]KVG81103.1 hypothetical protein WS81_12085 [Burkholderia sp. MSMB2040]KVG95490.1 hypothetical protein WS82_05515 [Burkholderia sp. MSMB2041]KVG96842.1 hypothetical protein WS83_02025 [Burkholderia sp. MSMB2042]
MSKKPSKKPEDDETFDPTVPDNSASDSEELDLPATFAHVPDKLELSATAREMFADLPENLIRIIIHESEEVAHSTRKILQEHMRIGGNFAHIHASVIGHFVSSQGDTRKVRNQAAELVYAFLTKLFRKSKSSVSLYIRCYNKFSNNIGAVEMLTISDMSLLVHNHISDEVVEKVIEAKREAPDLTKSEVKRLIASLEDQIAGKDNSIEEATSQLTATVGRLDDAQKEIDRLSVELNYVRQEQAREKAKAQETQVSLASSGKQVSTLQQTLANREREVEQLTAEIVKLKANPLKTEVPVPTLPDSYTTLQEAMSAKLAEFEAASTQLEQAQAQLSELEARAQEHRASIEASEVLEKKIRGLIDTFSSFVQDYHSAQLLATADGSPTRFKPLFQAFSDLIGKFHGEVMAAARA